MKNHLDGVMLTVFDMNVGARRFYERMRMRNLLDRGLKGAPMGAMNLSKKELKDLLVYINENF